jgi:hypothetical protein
MPDDDHSSIREAISNVVDPDGKLSSQVRDAISLAVHPWPSGSTSKLVLTAISSELFLRSELSSVNNLQIVIDRLLRISESLAFVEENDLADHYFQAADVLMNYEATAETEIIPTAATAPMVSSNAHTPLVHTEKLRSSKLSAAMAHLIGIGLQSNVTDIGECFGGDDIGIDISHLCDLLKVKSPLGLIDGFLDKLDGRKRDILISRSLTLRTPHTLEEVADKWKVTRERIRQIEIKALEAFEDDCGDLIKRLSQSTLCSYRNCIVRRTDLMTILDHIVNQSKYPDTIFSAILQEARFKLPLNEWCYTDATADQIEITTGECCDLIDHHGYLDHEQLLHHYAPLFWGIDDVVPYVKSELPFGQCRNFWVNTNTVRDRVLGAFRFIKRPASKEEIASLALTDLKQTSSSFANYDDVIMTGQGEWSLREFGDTEYHGIAAAISDAIYEAGGSIAKNHLIEAITTAHSTTAPTIEAYLTTGAFWLENEIVRLATIEEQHPGPPGQSTSHFRIKNAWGQLVLLEERHLGGHSLGVDRSIAFANGIKPGDSLRIQIANYADDASVIWRSRDINQTVDIGRIGPWLKEHALSGGDELLVVPTKDCVYLYLPPFPFEHLSRESPITGDPLLDI